MLYRFEHILRSTEAAVVSINIKMRHVLVSLRPNVSPPVCRLVWTAANATWIPASCHEIHDRVLGYIKMLPLLSRMGRLYMASWQLGLADSLGSPKPRYTHIDTHIHIRNCAPCINKLAQSPASSSHLQLRISALVLVPATTKGKGAGAGEVTGAGAGAGAGARAGV